MESTLQATGSTLQATRSTLQELKPWHIGQIRRKLRQEHTSALAVMGFDAHKGLVRIAAGSVVKQAWFVDGELYGIGGISGTLISSTGFVWLALSTASRGKRKLLVTMLREQLALALQRYSRLTATVLTDDLTSQRFALFMGFRFAPLDYPLPPGFLGMQYMPEGNHHDRN